MATKATGSHLLILVEILEHLVKKFGEGPPNIEKAVIYTKLCDLFICLDIAACMSILLIPEGASPLVVLRHRQHPRDPAHPCLPQRGVQARGGLCEVRGGGQFRVQSQAVRGLVSA